MKNEDYEKLEGKIIDFVYTDFIKNKKLKTQGKVIGCDPDIGITIVNANDPNHYLLCLTRPSSSLWCDDINLERNELLFNELIKQIKKGKYIEEDIDNIMIQFEIRVGFKPTAENCPFGQ